MSANPKSTPTKKVVGPQDALLGLSHSEARLLLLGTIYVDQSGKVDFEKIAAVSNIAVLSAKTMHIKAKKKLLLSQEGNNVATPSKPQPKPKASGSASKGNAAKRKTTDADENDNDDEAGDELLPKSPTPAKKRGRKPKQPKPEPEVEAEPATEPEAKQEPEEEPELELFKDEDTTIEPKDDPTDFPSGSEDEKLEA